MRPAIEPAATVSPVRPLPDTDRSYVVTQDAEVMEGRSVSISATATGRPAPGMTWRLPSGRRIASGRSYDRFRVTDDGTLVIDDTRRQDEGIYRAIAKNIAGLAKAKSRLRVFGQSCLGLSRLTQFTMTVDCVIVCSTAVIG